MLLFLFERIQYSPDRIKLPHIGKYASDFPVFGNACGKPVLFLMRFYQSERGGPPTQSGSPCESE